MKMKNEVKNLKITYFSILIVYINCEFSCLLFILNFVLRFQMSQTEKYIYFTSFNF